MSEITGVENYHGPLQPMEGAFGAATVVATEVFTPDGALKAHLSVEIKLSVVDSWYAARLIVYDANGREAQRYAREAFTHYGLSAWLGSAEMCNALDWDHPAAEMLLFKWYPVTESAPLP